MTTLVAVPNASTADAAAVEAIGDALTTGGVRLLDVHSDVDHGRSVFTLAGAPGQLAPALAAGARVAAERIDLRTHKGQHPHVGALDVAPVVWLDDARRGAASAEALLAAGLIGEAGLPVYLYGALAGGRTRAELRRPAALSALKPDFGPQEIDPGTGAVLVAARPPLVAFNLFVDGDAGAVARLVREGGDDGLPGVRALGMIVEGRPQVSTNVEDHRATPLAALLRAVEQHVTVTEAELVGLAPSEAFVGWPDRVPIRNRRTLEDAGVR